MSSLLDTTPVADWQNWSGSQRHKARVLAPADVAGVAEAVRAAAAAERTVRCVGSAHSFVPFWTDDVILALDHVSGLVDVDAGRRLATVAAGTKLHVLGPLLWEHGLSLPQQGDIDRQSLAGAIGTGTHGTGRALPNISNFVRAMTLVTADGTVRHLAPDTEPLLFAAAQVAQGALGVMVDVTLALDPAFNLQERLWHCDFAECAATYAALIDAHRHFEFWWVPRTDRCEMKVLDKTTDAVTRYGGQRIGPAWQIFPSDRDLRFNEMEYSVPFAAGWDCFCELRELLLRDFPKLPWPIEYRTLAADAIPLSTAEGRETVTLSVHQGAERDWRPLFAATEAVFRNHGGRPHWGKLHGMHATEIAELYPRFGEFLHAREILDPGGRFLNPYLRGLFERPSR
jgi:FAD/FMN-containing dehydrogenase